MSLIHEALEKGHVFTRRFSLAAALSSLETKSNELDAWISRQKPVHAQKSKKLDRKMRVYSKRIAVYMPIVASVLIIYFFGVLTSNMLKAQASPAVKTAPISVAATQMPVIEETKPAVRNGFLGFNKKAVVDQSGFVLSGIIKGDQPIAVINGELFHAGDSLADGSTVIKEISSKTVLLESDGRQLSLSL